MSESPSEPLSPCEVNRLLEDKPYIVQRLGHIANNAGIFIEFQEMVETYNCDLDQLKSVVKDELEQQGIRDINGMLILCDIPDDYED